MATTTTTTSTQRRGQRRGHHLHATLVVVQFLVLWMGCQFGGGIRDWVVLGGVNGFSTLLGPRHRPPRSPPLPPLSYHRRGSLEEDDSSSVLVINVPFNRSCSIPMNEDDDDNDESVIQTQCTQQRDKPSFQHNVSRGGGGGRRTRRRSAAVDIVEADKTSATATSLDTSQAEQQEQAEKGSSTTTTPKKPFQVLTKLWISMTRSKEKFMEEKLIQELSTIPVERVQLVGRGHSSSNGTGTNTTTSTPPTSPTQTTVIPPEVVEMAAKRAGLIGQPLTSESVQELGRALKRWYVRHGYVLHALESARLRPETATAEIQVQEPVVSSVPVEIVFCRQLWVDPETGELLTQQQFKSKYRRRHQPTTSRRSRNNSQGGGSHTSKNRRSSSLSGPQQEQQQNETMSLATLMANANTTLVETSGRTRPSKIAKALRLKPGQPFQWDERRWKAVCQSGIFRQVLHVAPQWYRGGDDDNDDKNNGRTVQLQLIVLEDKPSHLQYGLGRSGYTGAWEGDLHVDWANVWGGGESIGFSLGRGRQDDEPSLRARWTNPQFGLHRGYEVEAFSESLGNKALDKYDNNNNNPSSSVVAGTTEPRTTPTTTKITSPPDYDHDALVHRRGLSFRVQNPLNMDQWLDKACTSWSLERTTTKTGLHENICSCTLFLGPVSRSLSLLTLLREEDAYANLDIKLTTGSRFQQQNQYPSSSLMIQSTTSPSRPAVVPSGGGEEEDAEPHSQHHQTEQQDENKQEQEEEKEESHGQGRQSPFHLEQTLPSSSLLPTKLATRLPNIDLAFGPYAAASVTTRQTFPLVSTGTLTTDKRPVVLAFLHSVTASTLSLPRHEVRAQGIANTIRGCSSSATISHGRIATALRGTSELRIPIDIPKVPTQQDGKLVLFRDWLLATSSPTNDSISNRNNNVDPSSSSISYRQSCIGIGVRKSVQGIPLRFDVCCNHEGKIRSSIGFGRDFEAR